MPSFIKKVFLCGISSTTSCGGAATTTKSSRDQSFKQMSAIPLQVFPRRRRPHHYRPSYGAGCITAIDDQFDPEDVADTFDTSSLDALLFHHRPHERRATWSKTKNLLRSIKTLPWPRLTDWTTWSGTAMMVGIGCLDTGCLDTGIDWRAVTHV